MFDAYRHATNDIRVLYRIFRVDAPPQYQLFERFPGFDNLDSNGNPIDVAKNNGKPDRKIPASLEGQFNDYEFTAENLPAYNGFQVKVVFSSSNQAQSPELLDFRAIALA